MFKSLRRWAAKAVSFVGWSSSDPIAPFNLSGGTTTADRVRYAAEISDPLNTPLVMAAAEWLGRLIHEAPLYIVKRNDEGREVKRQARHHLLKVIERPNSWYSGKVMMAAVGVSLQVDSNAYLLVGRDDDLRVTSLFYEPHFTIRPRWYGDRIYDGNEVSISDKKKFIAFYEVYRPEASDRGLNWYRVDIEDVVHLRKGMDPRNPRKGLNRLAALLAELYTDQQRAHFSATVLANVGMIPFVVSPREANGASINEEQATKLKTELELRARSERGKPIVAGRAIRIDQLGFSPQDMDLSAINRIPKEYVASILGPNAQVLGFAGDAKTFSNYTEARDDAYESFLIPLHKEIAAELTYSLLREFIDDEMTRLEYDFDQIGAMQGQRAKTFEMWGKAYKDDIATRYTALVATGQPAEESDKVYISDVEAKKAKEAQAAKPLPSREQFDEQGNERTSPKENKGPVLGGKENG